MKRPSAEPSYMKRVAPYAALAIAYVLLNIPLIASKPENFSQIAVFSLDEPLICVGALYSLHSGSFIDLGDPQSPGNGCSPFPYGQLYPLLLTAPIMGMEAFVDLTESERERAIILSSVLVLIACGLVVLFMTYAAAARLYSPAYGLLAAGLMLATPEFLRFSNEIHPDVPQLAFLAAGFYFAIRLYESASIPSRRGLFTGLAAGCAGLAMAAKFNGFFLLPAIVVAYNSDFIVKRGAFNLSKFLNRNLAYGIGCLAVFAGVFVLCNPCYLAHPELAMEPFLRSADNSMATVNAVLSPWQRLVAILKSNLLVADSVVGYCAYALFLAGVIHLAWRLWTDGEEELRHPRILAEVYAVPFLLYSLLLGYGLTDGRLLPGYERYILPAVPMMYITALRVVAAGATAFPERRGAAAAIAALMLVLGQAPLLGHFVRQYRDFHLRKEMGFFAVHDWVTENIPKGAWIYTEKYIYVPEGRYRIAYDYAVNSEEEMRTADYVITKTLRYEIYSNPDRWVLYRQRPLVARSRDIYEKLERGELPGFERVALLSAGDVFGGNDAVAVYKNLNSPRATSPR